MFINGCLIYRDIAVKIKQERDYILLALEDKDKNMQISLSFNVTQAKVLAEGLSALLPKIKLQDLLETDDNQYYGDIKLTAHLPSQAEADQAPLSKTA